MAHGQDPFPQAPTCHETLQLCDKALRDHIKVSDLQTAIIEDHEKKTYLLEQQNQELRYDSTRWYKNPWIMAPAGGVAALLLLGAIRK
jgi:hypothetical protein